MKIDGFRCDQCGEVYHHKPMDIPVLPLDWFQLTKGDNMVQQNKHFCCIECLIKWTSCQTIDSRKFGIVGTVNNPPHNMSGEFKVTKEDAERWKEL